MITRCNKCRGTKKILGLGGMSKKCPTCKGIGSLEQKDASLQAGCITSPNGNKMIADKERVEIPDTALSINGEEIKVKRKYKKRAKQTDFTDALNEYV